jgi:hypothetical protein
MFGIIHGQHNSKPGDLSSSSGIELQYQLSFNHRLHTLLVAIWQKSEAPIIPNEDIKKIHYGKTFAAEHYNLLQKLRKIAHEHASTNGQKNKGTI